MTGASSRRASPTVRTSTYTLPPSGSWLRRGAWAPLSAVEGGLALVANERATEDIVREHFKQHGLPQQRLEEQTSSVPSVRAALATASKRGLGIGKPEFVITFPVTAPKLVIVVECKQNINRHESPGRDKPQDFAVDGVLHYSEHLAKHFDVIGIAVSGTDPAHIKVSTFRQLKGSALAEPLPSRYGPVDRLVPSGDYIRLLTYDPAVRARTEAELISFSRTLHNYMRDYAKIAETDKPLVVSGILLALRDQAFSQIWSNLKKPKDLAREVYGAIARVAKDADIPEDNREVMLDPYSFIKVHPELSRPGKDNQSPLYKLIADIDEHVRPFLDTYHDVDVIGQFYGEFLRYTGGDRRGLGIVLTPRHLTELFALIANVGPNDVVLDTCAGTGGFLIAAMIEMDQKAGPDEELHSRIRRHQLVGVEQQPNMFALAVSNMILRGDGKANLYQGSCFDPEIIQQLKNGQATRHERPNVGLINPPFSQKGEGMHELDFIEVLLDILRPGGTAAVVVPMSCAIASHPTRNRLLAKHTLVAEMSLPNDLFGNIGLVCCCLVFKAHQPHAQSLQPTWFAYWKDDGFIKKKGQGRIDFNGRWPTIRDEWVAAFHSRAVIPNVSVTRKVTADDEWSAEAYLETDYSALSRRDFELTVRKYAIFKLLQEAGVKEAAEDEGEVDL